jgi:hypothetical protein
MFPNGVMELGWDSSTRRNTDFGSLIIIVMVHIYKLICNHFARKVGGLVCVTLVILTIVRSSWVVHFQCQNIGTNAVDLSTNPRLVQF